MTPVNSRNVIYRCTLLMDIRITQTSQIVKNFPPNESVKVSLLAKFSAKVNPMRFVYGIEFWLNQSNNKKTYF